MCAILHVCINLQQLEFVELKGRGSRLVNISNCVLWCMSKHSFSVLFLYVLGMGCSSHAKSEIVQGVLLVLQQLFSNMTTVLPPFLCLKQVRAIFLTSVSICQ